MQISPTIRGNYAVWEGTHDELLTLGVWTEKKEEAGEDADPLVLHYWPNATGVIAVCDGVGGAGVQIAGRTADGLPRTSAWTAARAVRLAVEHWFVGRIHDYGSPYADPVGYAETPAARPYETGLKGLIQDALAQLRGTNRSRILGTMQRGFPTTLALVTYGIKGSRVQVEARWAGDSRCYLLTAGAGLQQLSTDDTELPDALESIAQDPPMTNQIWAGADFRINHHSLPEYVPAPCVVLCATDGFFNYVNTPAHFEYVLLDTLQEARSLAHWGALLADAVRGYSQDDATLALAAIGFHGFEHLARHFAARGAVLFEQYIEPMDRVDPADHEAFAGARADAWDRYRTAYERRASRPAEGSRS